MLDWHADIVVVQALCLIDVWNVVYDTHFRDRWEQPCLKCWSLIKFGGSRSTWLESRPCCDPARIQTKKKHLFSLSYSLLTECLREMSLFLRPLSNERECDYLATCVCHLIEKPVGYCVYEMSSMFSTSDWLENDIYTFDDAFFIWVCNLRLQWPSEMIGGRCCQHTVVGCMFSFSSDWPAVRWSC